MKYSILILHFVLSINNVFAEWYQLSYYCDNRKVSKVVILDSKIDITDQKIKPNIKFPSNEFNELKASLQDACPILKDIQDEEIIDILSDRSMKKIYFKLETKNKFKKSILPYWNRYEYKYRYNDNDIECPLFLNNINQLLFTIELRDILTFSNRKSFAFFEVLNSTPNTIE